MWKNPFLRIFLSITIVSCIPVSNKFNADIPENDIKGKSYESVSFHEAVGTSRKIEEPVKLDSNKEILSRLEFEKRLYDFLDWYYETHIRPKSYMVYQHRQLKHAAEKKLPAGEDNAAEEIDDPHDLMQGDQPATMKNLSFDEENEDSQKQDEFDVTNPFNMNITGSSDDQDRYDQALRERRDNQLAEDRNKETWLKLIQDNVLRITGRANGTTLASTSEGIDISAMNLTQYINNIHIPKFNEGFVTEKIRSYYPSCEIPKNTDQDVWNDENTMNLYFNVDHTSEENGATIATATLRLYRLPQENSSSTANVDSSCENSSAAPDEKLLRISIYWYTKSLKKHRVKRRLSDSKVVGESAKWVELSVRPATKAWSKGGKNLGVAILVEDQDGTVLKADKFFKGASCTQPQNLSQPSLSTQRDEQTNWKAVIKMMEEIQQQPCIITYHCSQQ